MSLNHEWFYFADLVSMLEVKGDEDFKDYLISKMIDLGSGPKFKDLDDILKGEKLGDEPKLVYYLKRLREVQDRPCYPWIKKFELKIKFHQHKDPIKGKSFLTPNTIFMHWPFPHPKGDQLKQLVESHAQIDVPGPLPNGTYDPKQHLLIDLHLFVIDKLIFESSAEFWDNLVKAPTKSRNKLLEEEALNRHYQITLPEPGYFKIIPKPGLNSNATFLECNGQYPITINIGLIQNRQQFYVHHNQGLRLLYDDWPDAFKRRKPC